MSLNAAPKAELSLQCTVCYSRLYNDMCYLCGNFTGNFTLLEAYLWVAIPPGPHSNHEQCNQ